MYYRFYGRTIEEIEKTENDLREAKEGNQSLVLWNDALAVEISTLKEKLKKAEYEADGLAKRAVGLSNRLYFLEAENDRLKQELEKAKHPHFPIPCSGSGVVTPSEPDYKAAMIQVGLLVGELCASKSEASRQTAAAELFELVYNFHPRTLVAKLETDIFYNG